MRLMRLAFCCNPGFLISQILAADKSSEPGSQPVQSQQITGNRISQNPSKYSLKKLLPGTMQNA